jgi:dGTP triphosphohydrolase
LGHDIGHPPFAHSGEVFLNEISMQHTGRHPLCPRAGRHLPLQHQLADAGGHCRTQRRN